MKKKSYWLSISVFVLILIWTVYYYAMQYTGGFADLKVRPFLSGKLLQLMLQCLFIIDSFPQFLFAFLQLPVELFKF